MIGTVRQVAYLVPNLETAMARWSAVQHVGPWFLSDPMPATDAVYRGTPGTIELRAASAYSGDIEIELIEPLGDRPSIYREAIDHIGYGLHHVCHHSDRLDADVATIIASGYELVQTFRIGDFRIVYLGQPGMIGSYIELIRMTPAVAAMMEGWRRAAVQWDGEHRVTRLDHREAARS